MPAVSLVTRQNILGEGNFGVILDGDSVVVPDDDEITQVLGSRKRAGLAGHTFFKVTFAGDDVNEMIERRFAGLGVGIE